jgi:hypothetical protein
MGECIMPNGKFRTAFFSAFLLAPGAGLAYPVHGVGSVSCAEFAKMYQGDPDNAELVFFSWAQGFMSGLNMAAMASQKQTRDLAGIAVDQKRALRSYCANNPLKNYMDGVIEFYGRLNFFPPSSN